MGAELRGSWTPLTDKEVFMLQFGETESTLREGRLVEAKVGIGLAIWFDSILFVGKTSLFLPICICVNVCTHPAVGHVHRS